MQKKCKIHNDMNSSKWKKSLGIPLRALDDIFNSLKLYFNRFCNEFFMGIFQA